MNFDHTRRLAALSYLLAVTLSPILPNSSSAQPDEWIAPEVIEENLVLRRSTVENGQKVLFIKFDLSDEAITRLITTFFTDQVETPFLESENFLSADSAGIISKTHFATDDAAAWGISPVVYFVDGWETRDRASFNNQSYWADLFDVLAFVPNRLIAIRDKEALGQTFIFFLFDTEMPSPHCTVSQGRQSTSSTQAEPVNRSTS